MQLFIIFLLFTFSSFLKKNWDFISWSFVFPHPIFPWPNFVSSVLSSCSSSPSCLLSSSFRHPSFSPTSYFHHAPSSSPSILLTISLAFSLLTFSVLTKYWEASSRVLRHHLDGLTNTPPSILTCNYFFAFFVYEFRVFFTVLKEGLLMPNS